MHVGFTGTQSGMSQKQLQQLRDLLSKYDNSDEFHHGDCIGADSEAHDVARGFSVCSCVYPPSNCKKRAYKKGQYTYTPKDYISRNHNIVNAVQLLIAAPRRNEEELRSGTWATIRYARKVNVPVIIMER